MFARQSMGYVVAMAAFGLTGGPACAVTHDLTLTGVLANLDYSVLVEAGSQFDTYSWALDGLSASNAITVMQGDVIHATVTFDQGVPVPASVDNTLLAFILGGVNFPNIEAGSMAATISLFNLGLLVTSGGTDCTLPAGLPACVVLSPPDNKALTFDRVTADFTVSALAQPVVLDNASVVAVLARPAPPVPEPAALVLALTGVGLLAARATRARRGRSG